MGVIADLLGEIPSAARYKSELEALERRHDQLQRECSTLREQVGALQLSNQKLRDALDAKAVDRLPDEREAVLKVLSQHEDVDPSQVAVLAGISIQRAVLHLGALFKLRFASVVHRSGDEWNGTPPRAEYSIRHEGLEYLEAHGLLE